MRALVKEFVEAAQAWAEASQVPLDTSVIFYAFSCLGSGGHKRVGRIDPSTLPPDDRVGLTLGQIHGHYTMDQLVERLEWLIQQEHMREDFLIVSIIRWVENELEHYADGPTDEQTQNSQGVLATYEALLSNPVKLQQHLKEENARLKPGELPQTERDIQRFVVRIREMNESAVTRVPEFQRQLALWREITAPIVSRERLRNWLLYESGHGKRR